MLEELRGDSFKSMLEEFRVDNFKSLINIVFQPQGKNLLTGLNNSGKTNLCHALQFVSRSASHSLDQCADVAGGRFTLSNSALDKSTVNFYIRAVVRHHDELLTYEYDLTISPPASTPGESSVTLHREVLSVSDREVPGVSDGEIPSDSRGRFDKTVLMQNIDGDIRILQEQPYMEGTEEYISTTASTNATMLQRIYDPVAHSRTYRFKTYLAMWTYYDLSPISMRNPAHTPGSNILEMYGSNLASVLLILKTTRERDYRRLLEITRKIEPRLDVINFWGSQDTVFMRFEDPNGYSLPISSISNGTLRFLAMAYILLMQSSPDLAPLCIIEEPENGIHAGYLKILLGTADQSSIPPQVVFTSHSPYFIDLFDDLLDGIFVMDQSKGHTSIWQPDIEAVKRRLEHFPLGEQHFRGML